MYIYKEIKKITGDIEFLLQNYLFLILLDQLSESHFQNKIMG